MYHARRMSATLWVPGRAASHLLGARCTVFVRARPVGLGLGSSKVAKAARSQVGAEVGEALLAAGAVLARDVRW